MKAELLTRNGDNNDRDGSNKNIDELLSFNSRACRIIRKLSAETEEQNKEQEDGSPNLVSQA